MEAEYWWNLDSHLAKVIASELRNFTEKNVHAYPSEMNFEDWHKKLNSIAARLEAYDKRFETESLAQELEIIREGQTALHEFADIFPSLWD